MNSPKQENVPTQLLLMLSLSSVLVTYTVAPAGAFDAACTTHSYYVPARPSSLQPSEPDPLRCRVVAKDQVGIVATSDGASTLALLWQTEPVAPFDPEISIYFRIVYFDDYDAHGPHWTRAQRVHAADYHSPDYSPLHIQYLHPTAAMSMDGSLFVCFERWEIEDQSTGPSLKSVKLMGRRFDKHGRALAGEFLIDETGGAAGFPNVASPSCAIGAPGTEGPDQVVAWQRLGAPQFQELEYEPTEQGDIIAIAYRWDGTKLIPRFVVSAHLPGTHQECTPTPRVPSASMDAAANFIVSFTPQDCNTSIADGLRAFKIVRSPTIALVKSNLVRHDLNTTSVSLDDRTFVGQYLSGVFRQAFTADFNGAGGTVTLALSGSRSALGASVCYPRSFPSITTYPSQDQLGCVSNTTWTDKYHVCSQVCERGDTDVFSVREDSTTCVSHDYLVNAGLDAGDQSTGPSPLSQNRGDRRQVATLSYVKLTTDEHAAFHVYAWQGAGPIGDGEDDPAGVFITLVGAPNDTPAEFRFDPDIDSPPSCALDGECSRQDRNHNNINDACEWDCNTNGTPDVCEIDANPSLDCNHDGLLNACDLDDCNNTNGPDGCEIAAGLTPDCNTNGLPDSCDIESQCSSDCNSNDIPDECKSPSARGISSTMTATETA